MGLVISDRADDAGQVFICWQDGHISEHVSLVETWLDYRWTIG